MPEPPQIVRHLQPQTATSGRSIRFAALVSGVPQPQVTWYKDSEALYSDPKHKFLHDQEEHTLLLLDVSPEDAGVYSCEAKNEYGEDTSSAHLTVEGRCLRVGCWTGGHCCTIKEMLLVKCCTYARFFSSGSRSVSSAST